MNTNEAIKALIDQMQSAYDEFSKAMANLEKEGNELVRETLKNIDKEKIAAAIASVKQINK